MRGLALGVLLCAVMCPWPAAAQEQRGTIEGVVKDAQGRVLPGAVVEARSQGAGASASATTDTNGAFRLPSLVPGLYDVTVSVGGFTPAGSTRCRCCPARSGGWTSPWPRPRLPTPEPKPSMEIYGFAMLDIGAELHADRPGLVRHAAGDEAAERTTSSSARTAARSPACARAGSA